MAEPITPDDNCPNCKIANAIIVHTYSFSVGFRFLMVCPNCAIVHKSSDSSVTPWWARSAHLSKRRDYGMSTRSPSAELGDAFDVFRPARTCPTKENVVDWNQVEGNWKQVRGKIKEQWGKLTDDDLDVIDGKRDQLEGKIQQRYGYAKDQVTKEIDDWYGCQTW
jgi:uncharacterized protein YjbJ (UPF0337 family)